MQQKHVAYAENALIAKGLHLARSEVLRVRKELKASDGIFELHIIKNIIVYRIDFSYSLLSQKYFKIIGIMRNYFIQFCNFGIHYSMISQQYTKYEREMLQQVRS